MDHDKPFRVKEWENNKTDSHYGNVEDFDAEAYERIRNWDTIDVIFDSIVSHCISRRWDICNVVNNWTHEQLFVMMEKGIELDSKSRTADEKKSTVTVGGVESVVTTEGTDTKESAVAYARLMRYLSPEGAESGKKPNR